MRLLLALLLPACASPALPSDQYDAIAVDLTASLAVDRTAIGTALSIEHGIIPSNFRTDGSAVSGTVNVTAGTIDVSYLVDCGDPCGSATTHSTVTYVSAGATYIFEPLVSGTSIATITHDGMWTLDAPTSGLESLAGTTTFDDDATVAGASYQFTITADYALTLDELGDLASGTAALEINASETGSDGPTTFSAKGTATITNDMAALLLDNSRAYAIDFTDESVGSD